MIRNRFSTICAAFALASLFPSSASAQSTGGFYQITQISGTGTREWRLEGKVESHEYCCPVNDFGVISLMDNGSGGYVILKEDGTLDARWSHQIILTYSFQPNAYWDGWGGEDEAIGDAWNDEDFYALIGGGGIEGPKNFFMAKLTTEATGTWSGGGSTVTLEFDCLVDSEITVMYKPEDSEESTTEQLGGDGLPVNVQTTGTLSDGELTFKIDALATWIPELAAVYLTDDRFLAVEDALRGGMFEDTERFEPDYADGDDFGEWVERTVFDWDYEDTSFTSMPATGELEPFFPEFYLLDVEAPFGFYVQGDWGQAEGEQEAEFRYAGEMVRMSVETGIAEAEMLDYGKPDTIIYADILSDDVVAETLEKMLIKVPVSPWAAPASMFSAEPGVIYTRDPLDWPVSLAATRALSDASIVTGIWGISGSATSTFEVMADSMGSPMSGALVTQADFQVAKKMLSFTLTGSHTTTLTPAGLMASGTFGTSPIGLNWQQDVSLLQLVPGAGAVLAAAGNFGERIGGGGLITVKAKLNGTLSGDYLAMPSDSNPRFTSGTLMANAELSAQVSAVPKFARGVVNLEVGGGGGADIVIQLAPSPSVSSLSGYVFFNVKAKFFNLETEAEGEVRFGDPLPEGEAAASPVLALAPVSLPLALGAAPVSSEEVIPAQVAADVFQGHLFGEARILYTQPHPTLPAPATQLVMREPSFQPGVWEEEVLSDDSGVANFAPVISRPIETASTEGAGNFSRGVVVWAKTSGAAPADTGALDAYLNTSELKFRYYRFTRFGQTFHPTERSLTDNALGDYGPELIECGDDRQTRLFWVRGDGMDLSGSTTPLQILARNWETYDPSASADDPSTAWSAETVAVSGLSHIVDWRVAAWDYDNAAVAVVADADGDLATLDDVELWLARQVDGTWAAPVRLTDNAVADEVPALVYRDADTLVIGWRQGDTVVGTFDYDSTPAPATWFGAASEIAEDWGSVQLLHRLTEDSVVAIWSDDAGLAFTEQEGAQAGEEFAPVRHRDLGDVVSSFAAAFGAARFDAAQQSCVVSYVVERSSPAGSDLVPVPMDAVPGQLFLGFGAAARTLLITGATPALPDVVPGENLRLEIEAESLAGELSYTWFRDGIEIPGADRSTYELVAVDGTHQGIYTVVVSDGTSSFEQTFTVVVEDSYEAWIAREAPGAATEIGRDDDLDGDGCRNVLEYLFGTDPDDAGDCGSGVLRPSGHPESGQLSFRLNPRALDVDYVIEYSTDLADWEDATSLFERRNLSSELAMLVYTIPMGYGSVSADPEEGFPFDIEATGTYRLRILPAL